MSPSLANIGFIIFLGMFLPINSNLNLYMDEKETFRLLGEFGLLSKFLAEEAGKKMCQADFIQLIYYFVV